MRRVDSQVPATSASRNSTASRAARWRSGSPFIDTPFVGPGRAFPRIDVPHLPMVAHPGQILRRMHEHLPSPRLPRRRRPGTARAAATRRSRRRPRPPGRRAPGASPVASVCTAASAASSAIGSRAADSLYERRLEPPCGHGQAGQLEQVAPQRADHDRGPGHRAPPHERPGAAGQDRDDGHQRGEPAPGRRQGPAGRRRPRRRRRPAR